MYQRRIDIKHSIWRVRETPYLVGFVFGPLRHADFASKRPEKSNLDPFDLKLGGELDLIKTNRLVYRMYDWKNSYIELGRDERLFPAAMLMLLHNQAGAANWHARELKLGGELALIMPRLPSYDLVCQIRVCTNRLANPSTPYRRTGPPTDLTLTPLLCLTWNFGKTCPLGRDYVWA
jgi:hypothetical protein